MFEDREANLFWMQTDHTILAGNEICEVIYKFEMLLNIHLMDKSMNSVFLD